MSNMHERLARKVGGEQGSALLLTAGMMVVLMGFMGLALDVGSLYLHRRVMQTAADAGALGGHDEGLAAWDEQAGAAARVGGHPVRFFAETDRERQLRHDGVVGLP